MKKHSAAVFCALLLLAACGKKEDVGIGEAASGDILNVETVKIPMPKGGDKKFADPVHGEEVWFAYAAIAGIDTPANGVIQSYFYEDGSYIHTMQLNIVVPEDGSFYEAWLVNEKTGAMVSLGHPNNHFGDTRHQMKFESDQDLRENLKVVVTLEKDDGNPEASETKVAEGLLKVTVR